MLPKINGKSLLECTEEDLQVLLENSDFRENEHIDYKQNFSFLEIPKGKERNEKITEFKSDICSFANAEGGYLIYGISDVSGLASKIIGIDISDENTDKFELDRRNNLSMIKPRMPFLKFNFVKLKNGKYVVIIFIKRDNFTPYIHIEDEKNYKIYKRVGNKKQIMTYMELKNMFTQSLFLEKEIEKYRLERINYYKGQENEWASRFLLFHIIPETFMDSSYNKNMFVLQKNNKKAKYGCIFSSLGCTDDAIPCVDGLRYVPWVQVQDYGEGRIYNNGIIEGFLSLSKLVSPDRNCPNGRLPWKSIWDRLKAMYNTYAFVFSELNQNERIFVCISLVGCKDVTSEDRSFEYDYIGKIDRDVLMCSPVCINNVDSIKEIELVYKKLYIEYILSIGKKYDEKMTKFIKDVYDV